MPATSPRVYVVEDESVVATHLVELLAALGYFVCGSSGRGEDAIPEILASRPDLVLMDIHLAGALDGIRTAVALRERCEAGVVFLTASSDEETLARAQAAAPLGFLVKPYEPGELNATLVTALQRRRERLTLEKANAELEERVRARTASLQRALGETEARLQQLADNTSEILWIVNSEPEEVLYVSPAFERISGIPVARCYADPRAWAEAVHPMDRPRVEEAFASVRAGRWPGYDLEYRILRPDGSERWVHDTGTASTDERGRVTHVSGVARDVTERKLSQAAAVESDRVSRATLDAIDASVAVIGEDGRILDVNKQWMNFAAENGGEWPPASGTANYLSQCDAASARGCRDASAMAEGLRSLIAGTAEAFELPEYACHGPHIQRWFLCRARRLPGEGSPKVVIAHTNITAAKKAEAEVRALMRAVPDLFFRLSRDGIFLGYQAKSDESLLVPPSEFLGRNFSAVLPPELVDGVRAAMDTAFATGEIQTLEYPLAVGGSLRHFENRLVAVGSGECISIIRDVTDRKQAERELEVYRSRLEELVRARTADLTGVQERLGYILSSSPVVLFTRRASPPFELTFVSENVRGRLGISAEELVGPGGWESITQDEERRRVGDELKRVVDLGRGGLDYRMRARDGARRWIRADLRLVRGADGEPREIIGCWNDVTDQRLAEEELRTVTRAVEQSSTAVVITGRDGTIRYVNPKLAEMTGYSPEEVLGRNPRMWKSGAHGPEFYAELWSTISSGNVWRGEICNRRKDGSLYWESDSIAPVRDLDGEVAHYVSIKEDVTERRRSREELHAARVAAEAASRAKSTFLSNMSHEIRTPMNAILGFSQLLQCEGTLTERQRDYLATINRSGEYLLSLIDGILEMSKIEAGRVSIASAPFDLHALLAETAAMFTALAASKGLVMRLERDPRVPRWVSSDAGRLRQVLINLIGNAVKFTVTGGVALRVLVLDVDGVTTRLAFEVEDTGPGLRDEDQERLFLPFEQGSAKHTAKGTGLGLSISHEFVRLMGGQLTVETEVGRGTAFRFSLEVPVAPGSRPRAEPRRVSALAAGQPRYRVLVTDDEQDGRRLMTAGLARVGFEIREARDGAECLSVYRSWKPDLVLLDVRMPEVSGRRVLTEIRATDERTPVIVVTASAFDEDRSEILALGASDFLRKPFREAQLLDRVGAALGAVYSYEAADTGVSRPPSAADEVLAALEPGLAEELREVALRADYDRLLATIGRLEATSPEIAGRLQAYVETFDYGGLIRALETGAGEGGR